MCLTGVDYFSTLGYQPGIAFIAAGALSPIATFILILLTLFGALPIYNRVAENSPHGQGSISMLEELLPRWRGKTFVLCLLGFAATDFVITITLSAADATAHQREPFVPQSESSGRVDARAAGAPAGGVPQGIQRGDQPRGRNRRRIALNAMVIMGDSRNTSSPRILPPVAQRAERAIRQPWMMLAVAALLFPRLALGLSGFETGVAVMPLVKGDPGDTEAHPYGRIANTKKLLRTAALLMTVFLMKLFRNDAADSSGGVLDRRRGNVRALAYLAHQHFGEVFGTIYDLSTITILWFAGASAMAGLLNLVPRYLPRYGMAPEWTKSTPAGAALRRSRFSSR
jgi:hypothetical protein